MKIEPTKWYIEYRVPLVTGDQVHRRGPYLDVQLDSEMADISGYEGVTDCRVVPATKEVP